MKGDTSLQKEYDKYRCLKIHSKLKDVIEVVDSNEPFLGICYSENHDSRSMTQSQFGIVVKVEDKSYAIYNINFEDDTGTHVCGLWSAPINICEESSLTFTSTDELVRIIQCHCIFIPNVAQKTTPHNDRNFMYSVLCENWCNRSQYGTCDVYKLPKSFYNNMYLYINS